MKQALVSGWTAAALGVVLTMAPRAAAQEAVWVTLFDGSNLDRFEQVGDANWTIDDGIVGATSGTGHLVTRDSYGDFELTLEFWVSADANSGVFIRASDRQNITATTAYEVNIYDSRPDQTYRTGGIVDLVAPSTVIMTGGQWNTYAITARGDTFTVVLNGTRVVDAFRDARLASGPFTLQYAAGTVRFRNIRIRRM